LDRDDQPGGLRLTREQKQEQEADEENSSGDWVSCLSYSLTVTAAARVWPKEACSMSVAPTSPSGDGRRGRQRHRRVSGAARRGDGAFLHAARPHRSGLRNATARGGESERRQTCRTSRCAVNARATVGADLEHGNVQIAAGRRNENCLDHRTSDRAPLFSANQLVPSYSERGHCAAITRSAPGNASSVPDPKRTAKPTNRIGKGAQNQGADGSRCYGQPRSYLTGWKSSSLNFLSIGGRYSRFWVNSPSPTAISE